MLDILKRWRERTGAPGVSVAIDDGHKVHCYCDGVSDLRANTQVSGETAFQLGSVSKAITAFVLLETLNDKGISVDAPIVAIAPDLRASNEGAFHDVTVRQILCHTSGLDSQWWVDLGRGDYVRQLAARSIAAIPLIARPGEFFSYSGPAYVLAGHLTEVLSGASWEDHVRDTVAQYLDDHSISARPEDILLRPSAVGYMTPAGADGAPVRVKRWYAPLALSPGGGIVATPADLAKLMRAMRKLLGLNANKDHGPSDRFAVPTIGWRYEGWGLGVARYRLSDGSICWGHDGTTAGQVCAVRLSEERPETVVVAANAAWAARDVSSLAEDIIRMRAGTTDRGPIVTQRDALANYPSWRLPEDREVSGHYIRLNATTLVGRSSNDELSVEEISSPQDEANWFGEEEPRRVNRVGTQLRRIEGHSYKSASKEFHFVRHPEDADRVYIHDGMRASVRMQRPWI